MSEPSERAIEDLDLIWPVFNQFGDRKLRLDGVDLGTISIRAAGPQGIRLAEIMLECAYRGQGHGTAALRVIAEIADRHDCHISLEAFYHPTDPDGGRIIRFYQKSGYAPDGEADQDMLIPMLRRPGPDAQPQP